MTVPVRLAGFLAALTLVFGATVAIGGIIGPTHRAKDPKPSHMGMDDAKAIGPQGLAVDNGRFRLIAATDGFRAGQPSTFRFRIVDNEGQTVRDFDLEHTRKLHLIVVRRDLTGYQHLHPTEQPDGSWSVPLRLATPGTYRVFTDFTAKGAERATLGTDLIVPGSSSATRLPAPVQSVSADGYDVAIGSKPGQGEEHEIAFTVTRAGQPVRVQPYLGAAGHLVVLRAGDLAYLHAHPDEEGDTGPIRFMVDYPSAGTYRLFLQFKHEGTVHTAAFTQEVQ